MLLRQMLGHYPKGRDLEFFCFCSSRLRPGLRSRWMKAHQTQAAVDHHGNGQADHKLWPTKALKRTARWVPASGAARQ
eukprot:3109897-Amphidinium_carterae.1